MKSNKNILIILPTFFLFIVSAFVALAIGAYFSAREIRAVLLDIFYTFSLTVQASIVVFGVGAGLAITIGIIWLAWVAHSHGTIKQSEAQLRKAQALQAYRDAVFVPTVAPPGSQVYLTEVIDSGLHVRHYPGHLLATSLNGDYNPADIDRAAWAYFQEQQSINKPPRITKGEEILQLPGSPPPLLPVLLSTQRLIIAGGSDSGKTTLIKHLIAARSEQSLIVPIDPHSPSKVLGFDVIGAGRDYEAIGRALEALVLLMHERYGDVARGLMGYQEHPTISVFIDEWTSIAKNVSAAGDMMATLLTESRKVAMYITFLAHSTTLEVLKLPDAQIKNSATVVELVGGNGEDRRAFILPKTTTMDGKRSPKVEYALPGPFTGFAQPRGPVVLELPDPKMIRLQKMLDEGASERQMAKTYYGIDHPGKSHYEGIRAIIERMRRAGNNASR